MNKIQFIQRVLKQVDIYQNITYKECSKYVKNLDDALSILPERLRHIVQRVVYDGETYDNISKEIRNLRFHKENISTQQVVRMFLKAIQLLGYYREILMGVKSAHDVLEPKLTLGASVFEMNISVRPMNCLRNLKIMTIRELTNTTEERLLKHKNMGIKSVEELRTALKKCGFDLKQS